MAFLPRGRTPLNLRAFHKKRAPLGQTRMKYDGIPLLRAVSRRWWKKGYLKGNALTMADLGLCLEELDQPLELLARKGARLVLTVALEEAPVA